MSARARERESACTRLAAALRVELAGGDHALALVHGDGGHVLGVLVKVQLLERRRVQQHAQLRRSVDQLAACRVDALAGVADAANVIQLRTAPPRAADTRHDHRQQGDNDGGESSNSINQANKQMIIRRTCRVSLGSTFFCVTPTNCAGSETVSFVPPAWY